MQKSCSRCDKNNWHVESGYILQPFNIYFSSLIDSDTSIIMSPKIDAPYLWTWLLDLATLNLAYGLLWIIMDRLYIPVIILHISIVAKNSFYCNDHTINEFGIFDSKNSSTAYVILYELIDTWFLDSNRSLIAPMALAYPLHPINNRSRTRRRNLWVGWCVSFRWPLFPSRSSVLIYICLSIWLLFSLVYQLCL